MKHTLTLAALTLAMLTAGTANAQAVRTEKNMSLELANQIATQSVSACAASSYAVTATVVDRAGGVRAVQRADNAGPHTVAASREGLHLGIGQGANACHHGKLPEERRRSQPQGHPRLPAAGRRRAVKVGNEVIGAVGVAGAPGGHLDDQCAQAAL
jgi:uncharacterized protein GlcG (DUF336 family)